MNVHRRGFGILGLLLITVLVGAVVATSWLIWTRNSSVANTSLKSRGYYIYLDGATDDALVNYYKLGITLKQNEDRGFVDVMPGPGGSPCPEVTETYKLRPDYTDNELTLHIDDFKRIENPKNLSAHHKECKILPAPRNKFDLDKNWLGRPGIKTINIRGLDGKQYMLDTSSRKLNLKDASGTDIGTIPFYPDKVAVLIAWGDSCTGDSKPAMESYIQAEGVALADDRHPQLESLYRRPGKEVHIILDRLKDTDVSKFDKELSPGCRIITTKPNLKSFWQKSD